MNKWMAGLPIMLLGVGCTTEALEVLVSGAAGTSSGSGGSEQQAGAGGTNVGGSSGQNQGTAGLGGTGGSSGVGPGGSSGSAGAAGQSVALIPALPDLDEALCRKEISLSGACANAQDHCLQFYSGPTAYTDLASSSMMSPSTYDNEGFRVGPFGNGMVFGTSRGSDGTARLWFVSPGDVPHLLQYDLPTRTVVAPAAAGYFWYMTDDGTTKPNRFQLRASTETHGSKGSYYLESFGITEANLTEPKSNGLAIDSRYVVAFADGINAYYPDAGYRVTDMMPWKAPEQITRLAFADTTSVVYKQCQLQAPYACSLWKVALDGSSKPVMVADLSTHNVLQSSIAVLGSTAYLLSPRALLAVSLASGSVGVIHQGEEFPQYQGTLKPSSLHVEANKLYLGRICHFDADYPLYGTLELDPVARKARWLNEDPAYPFLPHLVDIEPFKSYGPAWVTPRGIFYHR